MCLAQDEKPHCTGICNMTKESVMMCSDQKHLYKRQIEDSVPLELTGSAMVSRCDAAAAVSAAVASPPQAVWIFCKELFSFLGKQQL